MMGINRRDAEAQRRKGTGLSGIQRAKDFVADSIGVVRAVLREIFDESAYARFLARNRVASSGEAYAAFLQEKSGGRPRPRCC